MIGQPDIEVFYNNNRCTLKGEFQLVYAVVECQSVIMGETMFSNRQTVLARGISLIFRPAVLRIFLIESAHVFITLRLRQHRRSSDVGVFAVALHDAAVRNAECGPESVSVDDKKLWRR